MDDYLDPNRRQSGPITVAQAPVDYTGSTEGSMASVTPAPGPALPSGIQRIGNSYNKMFIPGPANPPDYDPSVGAAHYGADVLGGDTLGTPSRAPLTAPAGVGATSDLRLDPSVTSPRYGMNDRGAGFTGESPPPQQAQAPAPVAAAPLAPSDGMTDAQRNNAPFHADYLRMQDQQRVDDAMQTNAINAQRKQAILNAQAGQAGLDAGYAKRDAQVADFLSRNNAGGGTRKAREASALSAANARDAALGRSAAAQVAAANAPTPDYLNESIKGTAAVTDSARSRSAEALAGQSIAKGQQDIAIGKTHVEQQQRINSLGATLADPKADPKARQQAQESLLSLLGKDKPGEYKAIHAAGRLVRGIDGTESKEPDQVYVVNERTGKVENVVKLDPAAATGNPYKSQKEAHEAAKKAIDKKAPIEEVNAMLKRYGYDTL